jgi:hypothetical protein
MSYTDGWSALHLEMPGRIPRVEFDAESHWELVYRVTGLDVHPQDPESQKKTARQAFVRAWNYDLVPANLIGSEELKARCSDMGHGAYTAGGMDLSYVTRAAFANPEEVYAFDPADTYGRPGRQALIEQFNAHYREQCAAFPEAVNMTGTYVTLFSGLIAMLGWEMLLTAGGQNPARLGELANRYARWMQPYYEALAECEAPVIWSHDDIVWATGPSFNPAWYRKYIFPNYRRFYLPLLEAGKKVIFVSDGNYTCFINDLAAAGTSGFFFEPLTDLRLLVERYGQTHVLIGNVDTRILLCGEREDIRLEVERCIALGRNCPGYFIGVTNMIPWNTPVENALYYNEVYESLCRR